MAQDLAGLVDAARVRTFVGRTRELACFDAALSGQAPHRVLLVHGAGGLGKTALLHQFRVRAQDLGRPVVRIDGEDVDGSPEGLREAVARLSSREGSSSAPVLLIDAYERLASVDDWVRDELVASLPPDSVVVISGRDEPTPPWRTDPGWRAVVRCLPIGALDPVESVQLLAHAGVSDARRPPLARLGHGHPLTLAMLADAVVAGDLPDELAAVPDLVAALAARLVDEAPDDDHALAMALCAHSWLTTQDQVDRLLGRSAPEVWAWLETRPWVTRGTYGVYPHDLVRDVLDADLRRRSPATYRRINRAVHDHAFVALRSDDEAQRRLAAHQKLFLHRASPLASSFWTLRERGTGIVTPGRPNDHAAVLDMVRAAEGPESAALAAAWLTEQPESLWVARATARVTAFVIQTMHPADPSLTDADPVARAALDLVARTAPARPGEQVNISRFLGGATGGHRDPYAVVVGSVSSTILWTTRPLAWAFVVTTDDEFWGPIFSYLALTTTLQAEFAGLRHTLYGIDWRRLTPQRWFDLLGERELTGDVGPAPSHMLLPPPLSRDRFDVALRAALRDLHRPDLLAANDLLGSRLAVDAQGVSVERLRATILTSIALIDREPRGEELAHVLDRTYVRAARNQEAAAEVLGLPFSTYRRHLARAQERLADLLWAVEIGDVRLPTPS